MSDHVTEDGRCRARGRRVSHLVLWTAVLCVCIAPAAAAQQAPAAPEFGATVLDMTAVSRRITVFLNQSAIVQTTVEVARADVIASQIADVQPISPTQLLITGKTYGRTNVILWDKSDQQYLLDVSVELDLEALTEAFSAIDPRAEVQARSVQGNIILTGSVSSTQRAERMMELTSLFLPAVAQEGTGERIVQNHLNVVGEQQVLLRCVVAEVSRTAVRELGVNGFLAGDNVRDAFLVNSIGGVNPISIGAVGGVPVTGRIPFVTDAGGIPIGTASTLSLGFPRVQTQLFIKAMVDNSLLHVLAEPNLVAISGETATFLAGGEFPIPVPQGFQTVTIRFREFGVRLNFTPVVLGHQRIRLRVAPEVSELDFSMPVQVEGFVIPGLTTRSAETTIEIISGQTFAIAGLLSEQVRGISTRLPGIGDVPILGALFRSIKYQRSLTELVILVTPEIVAPLEPHQQVPIPGGDIVDPTDYELFALGLLEGPLSAGSEGDAPDDASGAVIESQPEELSIHGPYGHEPPDEVR